jgi:hypothetical protein
MSALLEVTQKPSKATIPIHAVNGKSSKVSKESLDQKEQKTGQVDHKQWVHDYLLKQGKELKPGLISAAIELTPEIALKFLELSDNFRTVRQDWVRQLAREMSEGRWKADTGEALIFNNEGSLVDGQHRCWAIVDSGISISTIVIWGVEKGVDVEIDNGLKRHFHDYLAKLNETNTTVLAAALRMVRAYELGIYFYGSHQRFGRHELLEAYERHTLLKLSMTPARKTRDLIPLSMGTFLHYMFAQKRGESLADQFFDKVATGVELQRDDPVYLLRNILLEERKSNRQLGNRERAAYIIKAWNNWLEGRSMKQLSWRGVGPTAEPFPEIT